MTLYFVVYNDNYFFSTWGVDSVCLTGSDGRGFSLFYLPLVEHRLPTGSIWATPTDPASCD